MRKQRAIDILGGTTRSAAACVGVVDAAIRNWPDPLLPQVRDRVLAGFVRMHVAAAMGLTLAELHESREAQKAFEEALAASEDHLLAIGRRARRNLSKAAGGVETLRATAATA